MTLSMHELQVLTAVCNVQIVHKAAVPDDVRSAGGQDNLAKAHDDRLVQRDPRS